MATEYTYTFCDLRTGVEIADLPLSGVRAAAAVSAAGSLEAEILLTDRRVSSLPLAEALVPRRTKLYVRRGDRIVWSGILWGLDQSEDGQKLSLKCATLESYYARALILSPLAYQHVDQLVIQRALLTYQSAKTGGDIGVIAADTGLTSGVFRDHVYDPLQPVTILQAWQDMADNEDGWEFTIQSVDTDTGVQDRLVQGYPSLSAGAGPVIFEKPGNLYSYVLTEDGVAHGDNVVVATGDEGTTAQTATVLDELANGFPRLESTESFSGVVDNTTLAAHAARAALDSQLALVNVPSGSVAPYDPEFGSYNLGDLARLSVRDWRFPAGTEWQVRIWGWSFQPPEGGTAEQVDLSFVGAPVEEEIS